MQLRPTLILGVLRVNVFSHSPQVYPCSIYEESTRVITVRRLLAMTTGSFVRGVPFRVCRRCNFWSSTHIQRGTFLTACTIKRVQTYIVIAPHCIQLVSTGTPVTWS